MIGENWNSAMYSHMRTVGTGSAMYFIGLVIFGNVIMLNLFLAILLGNFDRARNFGEKKKIFDAFENMNKMGYNLTLSITYLFDDHDFSKYISEKVIGKSSEDDENNTDGKSPNKTAGNDKNYDDFSETDIRKVFKAMTEGNIEDIL
jgi:hypothetical protein